MKEEWRWIPNFENVYKVSNFGRVQSFLKSGGPKVLKCGIQQRTSNGGGYLRVTLTKGGKRSYHLVHVLVCLAFIGEAPTNYEIDHKDRNRTNARLDNLEYVTRQENNKRAVFACGETHYSSRFTELQVLDMRSRYSKGERQYLIALAYNAPIQTIAGILKRRNWKHL